MRWTAMGALGAAVVTGVALTACSSGEASSPASSGGTSGGSAAGAGDGWGWAGAAVVMDLGARRTIARPGGHHRG